MVCVTVTPDAVPAKRVRVFEEKVQVYAPHRASLPPLGPYISEFWRRRRFAYELSRTTQKADHFNTTLGAAWLVLNPLLLGMVYFLLVSVLGDHLWLVVVAVGLSHAPQVARGDARKDRPTCV